MVELSVVIPTLNERDNIAPLLAALDAALVGIAWEAIFVDDDSQDGTAELVRDMARSRPELRVLQRIGRRGLASACTEGMLASPAPFVAVLDADLQHDVALLPRMLALLAAEPLDLVIGSRHVRRRDRCRPDEAAPPAEPARGAAQPRAAAHRGVRPDERLLRAAQQFYARDRARPVQHRLQDPARPAAVGAAAGAFRRAAVHLRDAAQRHQQARRAGPRSSF
ncbi:MAG: glycosyltransferase [Pseudomonadota bacterium]